MDFILPFLVRAEVLFVLFSLYRMCSFSTISNEHPVSVRSKLEASGDVLSINKFSLKLTFSAQFQLFHTSPSVVGRAAVFAQGIAQEASAHMLR